MVYGLALSPWDPFAEQSLMVTLMPITTFSQTGIVTGILAVGFIAHLLAGLGNVGHEGVGVATHDPADRRGTGDLPRSRSDYTSGVLRLALYAAIAFYLNTSAVRDAFLRRRDIQEESA